MVSKHFYLNNPGARKKTSAESGRDKAQVTKLIHQMLHAQLIRSEPNEQDKRSQNIFIMQLGIQLHAAISKKQIALAKKTVLAESKGDLNGKVE